VRNRARAIVTWAAAALFAVALVHRFAILGGPYFDFPRTVQDHVAPVPFASRDVILLSERAAEIIPRGATVTALQPSLAPDYDVTHWLAAFGMMPRHRVVPPELTGAAMPQYVLAVREPFSNPRYRLITELPEGRIYELMP
jgi:hypothetical protein